MADILIVAPRTRPEAVPIYNKHQGQDMSRTLHDYENKTRQTRNLTLAEQEYRPNTADVVLGVRRNKLGEDLGESSHPEDLSIVPRVKPEAVSIQKKNMGTLSEIYASYNDNVFGSRAANREPGQFTDNRPATAVKASEAANKNSGKYKRQNSNTVLKGPVPTDPIYSNYNPDVPNPARIKGNQALETYSQGVNGSLGKILAESYENARRKNMNLSLKKTGQQVKMKNFKAKNVLKIKNLEMETVAKRNQNEMANKGVEAKDLWRSSQYNGIESKVALKLSQTYPGTPSFTQEVIIPTPNAPRSVGTQITQTDGDNVNDGNFTIIVERPKSARPAPKTKNFIARNATIQNKIGQQRHQKVSNKNIIVHQNRQEILKEKRPQTASGEIPKYLLKRQEIEREKQLAARKNRKHLACPPGHKQLSQDERLDMLKTLNDTQIQLNKDLACCPGGSTTLRAKKYKEGLLAKIFEIDEAVRVFSKPVVFVKENR